MTFGVSLFFRIRRRSHLGETFPALEACRGRCYDIPSKWRPAAAKRAAGGHQKSHDYLAVEEYMNSKLAKHYRPHHPMSRFFLRYFGQARSLAMEGESQKKVLLEAALHGSNADGFWDRRLGPKQEMASLGAGTGSHAAVHAGRV
eukprot:scaffold447_cov307-Pinguiococcus_pyrenoidosus.AAC.79